MDILEIASLLESEIEICKLKGITWDYDEDLYIQNYLTDLSSNLPEEFFTKIQNIPNSLFICDNLKLMINLLISKIKFDIFIFDPPYNTKRSLKYNDNNIKWESFIYKRLSLLKELLKDDGIIYIFIGDKKLSEIKLISDKIFGEANFINLVTFKTSTGSDFNRTKNYLSKDCEYLLIYSKSIKLTKFQRIFSYKDFDLIKSQYKKILINPTQLNPLNINLDLATLYPNIQLHENNSINIKDLFFKLNTVDLIREDVDILVKNIKHFKDTIVYIDKNYYLVKNEYLIYKLEFNNVNNILFNYLYKHSFKTFVYYKYNLLISDNKLGVLPITNEMLDLIYAPSTNGLCSYAKDFCSNLTMVDSEKYKNCIIKHQLDNKSDYYKITKKNKINKLLFLKTKHFIKNLEFKCEYDLGDLWTDLPFNGISNECVKSLPNGQKPIKLFERLISLHSESQNNNLLIGDFFAGRGTTAYAVKSFNETHNISHSFVLCNINENNICNEILIPNIKYIYPNIDIHILNQ